MIKILSILDKNTNCICVRDAINTLYIPHGSKSEIAEEHEYQVDLYFDTVIEPRLHIHIQINIRYYSCVRNISYIGSYHSEYHMYISYYSCMSCYLPVY